MGPASPSASAMLVCPDGPKDRHGSLRQAHQLFGEALEAGHIEAPDRARQGEVDGGQAGIAQERKVFDAQDAVTADPVETAVAEIHHGVRGLAEGSQERGARVGHRPGLRNQPHPEVGADLAVARAALRAKSSPWLG